MYKRNVTKPLFKIIITTMLFICCSISNIFAESAVKESVAGVTTTTATTTITTTEEAAETSTNTNTNTTTLQPTEIGYSEFISLIEQDKVAECNFATKSTTTTLEITLKDGKKVSCGYLDYEDVYNKLLEHNVKFYRTVDINSNGKGLLMVIMQFLGILFPLLLLLILIQNMLPHRVKKTDCTSVSTRFSDVAGQEEAIESVQEVVDYLKAPKKYREIGAKSPKGVLLVGPPGTGKTLLAKAVAGEAGVNFIQVAGSDFVEKFVGVGASRVRSLFSEARKNSPCIVFIDEVDSVGQRRTSDSNSERDSTLTQILKEMDGFTESSSIVVIAATNRPEELDPAFTRPGRFDRKVVMQLPNVQGREDILKVHLKGIKCKEGLNVHHLAVISAGLSGADLQSIVNEATFIALKRGNNEVDESDLYSAFEVRLTGKEVQSIALSEEERRMIAYHEVGHAFTQYKLSGKNTLSKISIVPRTNGALGYILHTPTEEQQHLQTAEDLENQISVSLAGMCAEKLFIGTTTTGVSNDLEQATAIAKRYVLTYGMADTIYSGMTPSNYLGSSNYTCSANWLYNSEQKVEELLKKLKKSTEEMLIDNKGLLEELAQQLLLKETMTGNEFAELVSKLE